ncbi:hypothetical protein KY361_06325 [Candidatus Woesearchaeota archaeon]|nr:hypothetical protein [Candidatus Woesearchaeota archaeon]
MPARKESKGHEKYKGGEFIFVVGEDIRHNPRRLTYKRAGKIHERFKKIRVKSIGIWKHAKIEDIKLHDWVKLKHKPHIEGQVRHIDRKKNRIEFSHQGTPVFCPIHHVKKWHRKSHVKKKE